MKITVFTGGSSAERSVAIASAAPVVKALRSGGHAVLVVDTVTGILSESAEAKLLSGQVKPAPRNLTELATAERSVMLGGLLTDPRITDADIAFLALHGGRGEDGTFQHLLDVAGISYAGAGALASALAMDKDLSKKLFREAGVPVAEWLMVAPQRGIGGQLGAEEVGAALGWPVVVKPSKQGSTVGLSVVRQPSEFAAAIQEALRYDDEVMLEAFVPGREFTVGILGNEALAVGEIIAPNDLFDYESKYTPGRSQEIFPADLPASVTLEIQELGFKAHQSVKISGYSRVDFRLTPNQELYCLEVNTLPGLTEASLMPKSAAATGLSFGELCERIVKG